MDKKTPIETMIDMLLEKYDLELFEEFEIGFKNEDGSFETSDVRDDRSWRFTNEELQYKDKINGWIRSDVALCALARGYDYNEIRKKPFRPEYGSTYYYVEWINKSDPYVTQTNWENSIFDVYNLLHKNCFISPQIARKQEQIIYKQLRKEAGLS